MADFLRSNKGPLNKVGRRRADKAKAFDAAAAEFGLKVSSVLALGVDEIGKKVYALPKGRGRYRRLLTPHKRRYVLT